MPQTKEVKTRMQIEMSAFKITTPIIQLKQQFASKKSPVSNNVISFDNSRIQDTSLNIVTLSSTASVTNLPQL